MHKQIKQEWIKALRSGKYEQGFGALRKNDKFCCLGVLCEVVRVASKRLPSGTYTYDGRIGSLTEATLEKVKLEYEQTRKLAHMNDNDTSFLAIADYIESKL